MSFGCILEREIWVYGRSFEIFISWIGSLVGKWTGKWQGKLGIYLFVLRTCKSM